MMQSMCSAVACAAMLFASASFADEPSILNPSGMPVPRFASLKSDYVNARVGPGKRYPIRWVYKRQHLPVSITEEFANWRKIRDADGDGGWVQKTLLTGTRTAIVVGGQQRLYSRPDATSRTDALLAEKVIVDVKSCTPGWCRVKAGDYEGWLRKADIWGIAREEVFDK